MMRSIYILFVLFLVLLMACSTKRKFKAKTVDFDKCYTKSAKNDVEKLFMYNEGLYEFKLIDTVIHYEGVAIDWVTQYNPTTTASSASPSGYLSYIAFIDHQRVVLHTPYDTTKITFDYVVNDRKYKSFQRGYYFVNKEEGVEDTPVIKSITIELEDTRQKEKNVLTFEPIRNNRKITSLKLAKVTIDNHSLLDAKEKVLATEDLFSLVPVYYFNRKQRKLQLFWEQGDSLRTLGAINNVENTV